MVILVASIVGCGEKEAENPVTPTEENKESVHLVSPAVVEFAKAPWDVNGDGQIDILDLVLVGQHIGENVKAPEEEGVIEGVIGDTLSNGYYKVTVNEVKYPEEYCDSEDLEFKIEIENIDNKQATYVGDFNFWLIDGESYVYTQGPKGLLGAGKGVILNVGQKTKQNASFEDALIEIDLSRISYCTVLKGSKIVFQAYGEVLPIERKGDIVFYPLKEPIGRPIIFDFALEVLGIEGHKGKKVSGNGIIRIGFSKPIDAASLAEITITDGSVIATGDMVVEVKLENVSEGEQTLDVSAVTDTTGNPITGDTEFAFTIDNTPPTIVDSAPKDGESNVDTQEVNGLAIWFSEEMADEPEIIIEPQIRLESSWHWYWTWNNGIEIDFAQGEKLLEGTKYTVTIIGTDEAGNEINETIVFETKGELDLEPPQIVSSFPEHGAKDVDPEELNEGGMEIEFDEPLKKASAEVKIEGEALKWWVEILDDRKTIRLEMLKFGELPYEAEIVLEIIAEDYAGNKAEHKVVFTTLAIEDGIFGLPTGFLVSYWNFDEGKGNIPVDIWSRNDGKIIGAKWVDGKFGKALEFDGVDDIVEIPSSKSLDITQSITMMAWIKAYSPEGGAIIGKEGAYSLSLGDGLNIEWIIWGNEWETRINISQNEWNHIALVYDFSSQKRLVYLDGELIADKETIIPIPVSDKPLIIGKGFKGVIDEVAIWSRALNQEEVQNAMF